MAGERHLIRRRASTTGMWTMTLPASPLFTGRAAEVMAAVGRQHLDLILQTVSGIVAERTPRSTGHLAQGWQTEVVGASTDLLAGRVFNTVPYGIVIDEGRRPGFGISRVGLASLGRWVRRTLGLSGAEAKRATYAIAWAIRTRGIKARHFVPAALKAADPQVRAAVASLSAAYARALTAQGAA